jgi:hypothetical protein
MLVNGLAEARFAPLEAANMKQIFEQLIQLLQQGIAAIFRFVELVWSWTIGQVTRVAEVPWGSWPLWKQIILIIIAGAILYVLFRAGKELWDAGEKILAGFASLLVVFVKTLPLIIIAGLIAAGGLWIVNSVDLERVAAYLPQGAQSALNGGAEKPSAQP